jgi:hypothetical protein
MIQSGEPSEFALEVLHQLLKIPLTNDELKHIDLRPRTLPFCGSSLPLLMGVHPKSF